MKALINAQVLTPDGFKQRQSILFQDGMIIKLCCDEERPPACKIERDLGGQIVLPGFIDTQVNGGGGVLFNDNPSVDSIRAIGDAHRKFGTTGFFPTLISDNLDVMERAIAAVETAIVQGVPGVLGIHLEGPFLNAKKSGVHDSSKFKEIGKRELELVSSLRGGNTLLTLAPENTTPDIIRKLVAAGVTVSAGHTLATFEDANQAMNAGLTGFTHLFNAMPNLLSRNPGVIAAALQDKRAWCGIIADGHHVHPAMLRLALRAKSDDQIFLVTDAMPSVDAADKDFSIKGLSVKVAYGKCLTNDGTLAGSDLDMMSAVRNSVNFLEVDLAQAVRMASIIPARFMNIQDQVGEISEGLFANFCVVSDKLEVVETWIKGESNLA